jgi:hypothetical protein
VAELTLANRSVMTRAKCAVKITRKYFVASFAIVSRRVGMPNCRIVERPAKYSIIKNARKSFKGWVECGVSLIVRNQINFRNALP